jgi:spore germination protein GerM
MDALARGPSGPERALGVRTAVPPLDRGEPRVVTSAEGRTALVELTDQFDALSGAAAVTALAQIVYTLTEDPDTGRVRFLRDGREITVPRADLTRAATVTRADYPLALVARRN